MVERYPAAGRGSGKERLIEATQALLQNRPFDEVTVDEIIKEAKLSRPAFYYHFAGGKEELRAALTERGVVQQAPAQDTRETILEAALRAFARSGISATTLDEIAAEAGVTRGTLCWHFHSKEELLSEIVRHYSPHAKMRVTIDQVLHEVEDGRLCDEKEIFRRIAGAFYDTFTTTCQGDLARLAILLVHTHPETAQLLSERIARGRQRFSSYVQKQQAEGHFRTEIAPELIVQVIASFFAMRAVGRGLPFLVQLPREELIEQLVSLLLYGLVRCDPSLSDTHTETQNK